MYEIQVGVEILQVWLSSAKMRYFKNYSSHIHVDIVRMSTFKYILTRLKVLLSVRGVAYDF